MFKIIVFFIKALSSQLDEGLTSYFEHVENTYMTALREEFWAYKTILILPLFIEMPVPNHQTS
jgi:hypothetical protein